MSSNELPSASSADSQVALAQMQQSFRVQPQRWLMLTLFSAMAVGNNLVCFTFAPISKLAEEAFGESFPVEFTITIFFLSYVMVSFPASNFIDKHGLRLGVVLGGWFQAIGAVIRCLNVQGSGLDGAVSMIFVGQVIASFGQAFFVNPPPLVASIWFADDERTLATTVACNADVMGIAVAFIVAPLIAEQVNHIPYLLQTVAAYSVGCAILTTLLFAERPSSPPSYSALLRILDQERNLTASRLVRHQIDHARSMERQRKLAGLKQRRNLLRQQTATSAAAAAAGGPDAVAMTEMNSSSLSSSSIPTKPEKSESLLEPSPLSAASYTQLDDDGSSPLSSSSSASASLLSPRVYSGSEVPSSSALSNPFSTAETLGSAGRKTRSSSFNKPSSLKKVQTKSTQEALADIQAALEVYEDDDDVDEDEVIGDQSQSWRSLLALFKEPGFVHTVVAFAFTESTLNVYSTFMNDLLSGGFSTTYVSWMGTFFVVANLVGSQIVSTLVDKYKTYQKMMMISFIGSVVSMILLTLLLSVSDPSSLAALITILLLAVGSFVGPLAPLAIEVAAECTYPAPEASFTAVQQVMGNLASAGLIPLMALIKTKTGGMNVPLWINNVIMILNGLFFLTFNGSFRRLEVETSDADGHGHV